MHAITFSIACLGVSLSPLLAQSDFASVNSDIDAKLEASLAELAEVRDEIATDKIPLSRSVNELESEVVTLRREQDRLLKIKDSRTIDLSSLRTQVDQLEDQAEFVGNRLKEFINEFEGRVHASELPFYQEDVYAAKQAPVNVNLTEEEKRDIQIAVVDSAMKRIENLIGGHGYEGSALSDGVLLDGRFVSAGPAVYFASNDGSVYGLVESQANIADPVVVDLPNSVDGGINDTATSGTGTLPFDVTGGKALKVEMSRKSLGAYVEDGGEVGYVIIALGIIGILLAFFKCFEILGFKVAKPKDIDAILDDVENGNHTAAQDKANKIGGSAGEMLAAGVVNSEEKRGILEEMMFERILKARPYLERFLPFLAITAAAAPLLGLLGTVIGMIKTFQLITIFGTGDAKSLSSGISEALVTTALGLIVAIPTLILHGMLSRMAKRKLGLLEQGAVAFVNGVMARRHQPTPKPEPEPVLEESEEDKKKD
ncbi:MAG: MotA/TolQ/ExbB proton channel family protein [Verrucomicrobiota bacterium]